jgi:hypothetical protein
MIVELLIKNFDSSEINGFTINGQSAKIISMESAGVDGTWVKAEVEDFLADFLVPGCVTLSHTLPCVYHIKDDHEGLEELFNPGVRNLARLKDRKGSECMNEISNKRKEGGR